MANIILGVGSSHGPLLNLPPEEWEVRANFDRAQPELAFREGTYTFPELAELRACDDFIDQCAIEVKRERHAQCQSQLDDLGAKLRACNPDVILIVGDDQREWFFEETQPAFAIYCGNEVKNLTWTEAERAERGQNRAWRRSLLLSAKIRSDLSGGTRISGIDHRRRHGRGD